ncbi:Cyclopentanone 1,2-monooxygenase (CPMO) [Podila epigama]|nr:Cyclopentanone 1,2-monooxygenase (CPMO) [Podila epigama]
MVATQGASGLTAIKECLDEKDSIDVVCFEQESYLGGLWRYVDVSEKNPNPHSSVYKSTIINTSKELMSFSDFAIPAEWPTYLPNQKVAHYFDLYSKHFKLKDHIRFETKVVEVKELKDEHNRWVIRYHPANAAAPVSVQEETFDYVMMCSGHHWKARYPAFPGMSKDDPEPYTGIQLHSHFYRQADAYRGKNVVVVGLGNSAVDLAVELSQNQSQVYLSARRGAWILPRWLLGKPLDHIHSRLTSIMPLFFVQLVTAWLFKRVLPPAHPNLKPERLPLASHPTINTLLGERVSTGTIKPVKNIRVMGPGKRVQFEDGTVIENVDVIFYCTGYHITFPVLNPDIVTDGRAGFQDANRVWTWKYMVPPRHPNLAFVGLVQPLGAIMPISEMQCRFLVRTLVGKLKALPSENQMDKEIQARNDYIRRRYDDAPRHTIQVDYASYCDELAQLLGCMPTLGRLLKEFGLSEGTKLWLSSIFGPPFPVFYRLVGPHAWDGAREVVWGYACKENMSKDNTTSASITKNKVSTVFEDLESKDNRIAVVNKPTNDIIVALFVYRVCTWLWLVNLAPSMISLAESLHLSSPVYWVIRKTFFAQFCGGETAEECLGTMNTLKESKIGTILDLSVEADLKTTRSSTPQNMEETRKRLNAYADDVAQQIKTCIKAASTLPKTFAAVKITALGSLLVLEQVTSTLTALEQTFASVDKETTGTLDKDGFAALVRHLSGIVGLDDSVASELIDRLFQEADQDQDGLVEWVDVQSTLSFNRTKSRNLFVAGANKSGRIPGLTQEDLDDYGVMLRRLDSLCELALKSGTRLMFDAEQTYFQLAINTAVLYLQEKFNVTTGQTPLIYNTYQMYLKAAPRRLREDLRHARRNGFVLAAKMVRGAYMVSERKRAKELGLEDPIMESAEATHKAFDAAIELLLQEIGGATTRPDEKQRVTVMVATHNKDSIVKACRQMQTLGISPASDAVTFGQLFGMCDQVTYTLAQHGYGIYKYIAYGPIQQVIPYLLRYVLSFFFTNV